MLTVALLLIPSLNPAAAQGSDDWPMFHHDARHTGYTSAAGHLSNPMSRWGYTLYYFPNGPIAADVDGDGEMEVIVTDASSRIYRFDGDSGTLEWSKRLGVYGYGIVVTRPRPTWTGTAPSR